MPHPSSLLLLCLLSATAASPLANAQQPTAPMTLPRGVVHVDAPGDGHWWAKGDDWKASFGADGLAFVPFLGADVERNFPLALRLVGVRSGDTDVPFVADAMATRTAERRVEIARGSLVEAYDLRPEGIEQTFVFANAKGRGALAVELAITSELLGERLADGSCRFRSVRGGVDVGSATAIDRNGKRAPCRTDLVGDRLRWTVPAEFVASAAFPLTIDPVITTSSLLPAQMRPLLAPDVAFVGSWGGYYGAVLEEIWSAADHDIVVLARDLDGNLVDTDYVDVTTVSWIRPKIASHRIASQFLCVAQRNGGGAFGIAARLVGFSALGGFPTLSPLTQIPVTTSLFEARPDVGGDASILATLPGDYCITWEASGSIYYRRIDTTGTFGLVQFVPTALPASNARIAKSCGTNLAATADWTIVFEQEVTANDHDVHGVRLSRTGVLGSVFPIATGPTDDRNAEVSSKAERIANEPYMVVWDRFVPGGPFSTAHYDIHGRTFVQDSPQSPEAHLTSLLLRTTTFDQTNPCVDSDGIRFAVGFSERAQAVSDVEPYLATVHLDSNQNLAVTVYGEQLNASPAPDDHLQIASTFSGGLATTEYMAVWDVIQSSSLMSGQRALYRGHTGLTSPSYFNYALPGCGPMQIVADGLPALGQVFSFALVNAQAIPVLVLGTSIPPVQLCPSCQLGVDPTTAVILVTANLSIAVPPDTALIAVPFAAQGLDFLAPGGCDSPILGTLTDEIIVTLL